MCLGVCVCVSVSMSVLATRLTIAGKKLASGSVDGSMRVWNPKTGATEFLIAGTTKPNISLKNQRSISEISDDLA